MGGYVRYPFSRPVIGGTQPAVPAVVQFMMFISSTYLLFACCNVPFKTEDKTKDSSTWDAFKREIGYNKKGVLKDRNIFVHSCPMSILQTFLCKSDVLCACVCVFHIYALDLLYPSVLNGTGNMQKYLAQMI